MTSTELQHAYDLIQQGQFAKAAALYKQRLTHNNRDPYAHLGLATIAMQQLNYDQAIAHLQLVCQLLPDEVSPLLQLADAFHAVGSHQDVTTLLNYAHKRFTNHAEIQYRLAKHCVVLGRTDAAVALFTQVLASPFSEIHLFCWFELVKIDANTIDHAFEQCLQIQQNKNLSIHAKIVMNYTLGYCADKQKNMAQAADFLKQANQLQLKLCQFSTVQMAPFYQALLRVHAPHHLKRDDANDPFRPIFIIGLPRTGSSLLAQMLDCHSQISNAGEQPFLARACELIQHQLQLPYPDCLTKLSTSVIEQAAHYYLNEMRRFNKGKSFVIDKLPANFQSVPVIKALFPNAIVIDLKRRVSDVAWSIYENYFAENEPYFCSLEEMARYNQYYLKTMDHWLELYPDIITLEYENLINDPAATLQSVIHRCGLDFEAACLHHDQSTSAVDTLSSLQVRRPIYKSAVARSDQYRPFVTELSLFE
ncbi:hypothetical protein PULV_b0493 [Pseudoalteromonas ulvae UL12]|uniref:tetratricopeptide repeat-containing sulfotransferase family protein n=1 Tax=Pseudoalteromonas ulvae TaxID=107327 RepID=UPI00186B7A6C|nr:sulfotransferase [Pseudoalteromonas ulvae]MBE0365821.1 hypothetical protein [Pseudoalteromonas ulvae UL12]